MENKYEEIVKYLENNNWKKVLIREEDDRYNYSDFYYAKKGYQVRLVMNVSINKNILSIYSKWRDMTVYYGECSSTIHFENIFNSVDFE